MLPPMNACLRSPAFSAEAITHYKRLPGMRKKMGDSEAALELYDRAIAADPKLWPALNEKGVLLGNSLGNARRGSVCRLRRGARGKAQDSAEVRNNIRHRTGGA